MRDYQCWQGMTRTELDREYSPSSIAPDAPAMRQQYALRSLYARWRLCPLVDLRYGEHPCEALDMFPGQGKSPLVAFVHGGHWQESGKGEGAFLANYMVSSGCAFAAIGYGLAPARTLPQMVSSVARAIDWLAENARTYGADPQRLIMVGSSAGAHLISAALCVTTYRARTRPHGAVLLSGVYDLAPLRVCYVNDRVGMDAQMVELFSPIRHLPIMVDNVLIARGEQETSEYGRQHRDFVTAVRDCTADVTSLIVPNRDHFSVVFDLANPRSDLGREFLRVVEGGNSGGGMGGVSSGGG